jgi:hypothetical protein
VGPNSLRNTSFLQICELIMFLHEFQFRSFSCTKLYPSIRSFQCHVWHANLIFDLLCWP